MMTQQHPYPVDSAIERHAKKSKKTFFIILIILLIVLGTLFYFFYPLLWPGYYAVYMETGDIYFGKMVKFPRFALENAWYIEKDAHGSVSANPFSKVIWQPKGTLYLNSDKIVWIAPLRKDTQLYAVLMNNGMYVNQNPSLPQQEVQQLPIEPSQGPTLSPSPDASSTPSISPKSR